MKRSAATVGIVIVAVVAWWLLRGSDEVAPPLPSRQPPERVAELARSVVTERAVERPDGGAVTGAPPSASPNTIATFGWGNGPAALGRSTNNESNPEAPMSVTVAANGDTVVLDQVNGRALRVGRDGAPRGSVQLPVQAAQDVVVTSDGTTLVMDRLVDRTVAIVGPDGKPKGELRIEGKGLPEGGGATGLFVVGDDVYVERAHGDSVHLGTTSGVADPERSTVPGRPTRDGRSFLTASITSATEGTVLLTSIERPSLEHRFSRQLHLGVGVSALVLLDADASGQLYLGALTAQTPPQLRVLCADGADGHVVGSVTASANTSADETFRELAVADDGTIVYLLRSDTGAQLLRLRCAPR